MKISAITTRALSPSYQFSGLSLICLKPGTGPPLDLTSADAASPSFQSVWGEGWLLRGSKEDQDTMYQIRGAADPDIGVSPGSTGGYGYTS